MAQVATLSARVIELEAKLNAPPKTPDNSSLPPSKGQKPNLPQGRKKRRHSHPGVARALAENPDRVIEARLTACPNCDHALDAADQSEIHAYDHIDLPPIKPIVTRINRHHGVCPCCRKHIGAPPPEGFVPGSPFGPGLCALIIHLHITQAISFERLALLMADSRLPSFSHCPESLGEDGQVGEHIGEFLDQWQQARLRHGGDEFV
ncbi:IS66 family transposase zinc-finger binding domain-containing protein [Acidiphilium sp. AL]|uniref:IS66 family transposase zinc-finger binding domain-containing protein n=1 Tax=Acidiphilium sp. AL TaxID=2871704 RepID=UPI0021CAE7B4|nr:IS66 family transposase zinc-finger binding domain-containing protein [Acidiphilium sp. AL]